MASRITLFPQITDEILSKTHFSGSRYEFFYTVGDEEFDLECECLDDSTVIGRLVDEKNGKWEVDQYNLGIKKSFCCPDARAFFGPEGIACKNATIGVAVVWTSAHSRQRGTIPIGEINNISTPQQYQMSFIFGKAMFRGSVEFNLVLYIKEEDVKPCKEELYLANTKGLLLGSAEDKFVVQLDGSGSMFPIYEEMCPGEPLWRVKCEYDDVLYSMFNECVAIYLNKSHASFKYIDKTNKNFNKYMLLEVISSALSTIIMNIKFDEIAWGDIEQSNEAQTGSIAEAINYFINTLEWKTNDAAALSLSIRRFLEKRM